MLCAVNETLPPPTTAHGAGRLTEPQVNQYEQEGYLIFKEPVLPKAKFDDLKAYFDKMLADLPADQRPEAMDVPHFMHPKLLDWALDESVLGLVEPILGPDIALFSTHFICKPTGNGKRVPWHEDSAYWQGRITPMEVCTVWLAIDPSTRVNGCMMVIPRTHREGTKGFSDYDAVDGAKNVSRRRSLAASVTIPSGCTSNCRQTSAHCTTPGSCMAPSRILPTSAAVAGRCASVRRG